MDDNKKRCDWSLGDSLYQKYHDEEWGRPLHDDQKLFELLCLGGAQAGLQWITILKRRENYRKAFDNFDVDKILLYDDNKINELLCDNGIIRNRLKVNSVITNAKAFKAIQREHLSFDRFIWSYVDFTPINNNFETVVDIPASTELSKKISGDLKKLGFKFVGETIIYAYMQSIGMVNDHINNCFCKNL